MTVCLHYIAFVIKMVDLSRCSGSGTGNGNPTLIMQILICLCYLCKWTNKQGKHLSMYICGIRNAMGVYVNKYDSSSK